MRIREATLDDMQVVRDLFVEYQQWLGVDLCFQGFEQELAELPGGYAPPHGAVFLAVTDDDDAFGCVALRPFEVGQAELKRLYVRPSERGRGAGRALFEAAMQRIRELDYTAVVLDTLPSMDTARAMYVDYGFRPISAYYENPLPGVDYLRLDLSRGT